MSMRSGRAGHADVLAGLGTVAVLVSMPLEWLGAPEAIIPVGNERASSVTGLEASDPQLVLVAVVLCGAVTLFSRVRTGRWSDGAVGATLLAGLFTTSVVLLYLTQPGRGTTQAEAITPGIGLYLAGAGGLLLLAAALFGHRTDSGPTVLQIGSPTGSSNADRAGPTQPPVAAGEEVEDAAARPTERPDHSSAGESENSDSVGGTESVESPADTTAPDER